MIVYPDYAGIYCRQYTPGDRRSARARSGPETAGELRATMYPGRKQRMADRAGIDAGSPRPRAARAGEGRNSAGLRPARNTIPFPGQFPAVLNKAQWRGTY